MHYSVLLEEAIGLLAIKPDGIYVDGTFGRGGHCQEILKRLDSKGKLIAFDKDPEAIDYAKQHFNDERLIIIKDSFANLDEHLNKLGLEQIDGLLLDLGVSSPQLDNEKRGFSYRFNSQLDMRMDNSNGINAKDWLNSVDEKFLADILWRYGEERLSRKIARKIVEYRASKLIDTTFELATIISDAIGYKEKGQHPATRSFQAIRIYINSELEDLEAILAKLPKILADKARVVIISFHSLEDRIVKNAFNALATKKSIPKWIMQETEEPQYTVVAKKVRATPQEVSQNPRSRSAILRCLAREMK